MFNITHYQRNANQNHNEVPLHASQDGCYPRVYKQQMLERVWRKGNLLQCWWECKLVQPLWTTVWRFLKKLEIALPYDPAVPLLGIHTEETRNERETWTAAWRGRRHLPLPPAAAPSAALLPSPPPPRM